MSKPLSPSTIAIVKATIPALESHGLDITTRMYAILFEDPAMRALFNKSHQGAAGAQPRALADAVLAYARNIDNLGVLGAAVERIAQKHVALRILPEHYSAVASALIGAIRQTLGEAATDEIIAAWGEAYWFLAEILIGRETDIVEARAAAPGGWTGWRNFVVTRVEPESATIKSFYLRPEDGGEIILHKPGQYLTFELDIPGLGALRRNYSLSCAPGGGFYRATIKRETTPAGVASNWLHDHALEGTILRVAPPSGEFTLDVEDPRPVVLLSGGVGLTPMVSMLEVIARDRPGRSAFFVHAAHDGSVHAMREHVASLAKASGVAATIFYARPGPADIEGEHYDRRGLVDVDWLRANTPTREAVYYICGPKPFMAAMVGALLGLNVPEDRIRYEFFGPAETLAAA